MPEMIASDAPVTPPRRAVVFVRTIVAGLLMGLANLVPGVSGGTMVLVMGLYDDFVSSVADLTRFRFTRKNLSFLILLVGVAGLTFASLADSMQQLVEHHRRLMYAIFVGLTLGGAPTLTRMVKPFNTLSASLAALGLLTMAVVAMTQHDKPEHAADFVAQPNFVLDVLSGVLGMSAMVLPGISGASMLLIIGRYESIYAAVGAVRDALIQGHGLDDPSSFRIVGAVALGALISMVGLTNLLKWLLHKWQTYTLAFLLGILIGSVLVIPPFDKNTSAGELVLHGVLILVCFTVTLRLSRLSQSKAP